LEVAGNPAGTGLCGGTVTTDPSSPYRGGLTATGVGNEEAISPKCWLRTSKEVNKIIIHITEAVGKSREVHDLFPSSVFILVLWKQGFSLGSSLCPRIILELKNTSWFVMLLPLPQHCFWGVLWLAHLMLRAEVAGGDVKGGVFGFLVVFLGFWLCF